MKSKIVTFVTVLMIVCMLGACAAPATTAAAEPVTEPAATTESAAEPAAESAAPAAESKFFKVGYAAITMNGDFFVVLADALAQGCVDNGLIEKKEDFVTLDAAWDTGKEISNMDTFIAQDYDVVFIDTTNPDTMIPMIDQATEAGIIVICVDSYVSECSRVTVCYGDNKGNGFAAGKTYADAKGPDFEIYSIMLSGIKGNIAGEERRVGMMAGVLASRLGIEKDAAFELAYKMNDDLIANNYAEYPEAKFVIAGQGWGGWSTEGIMNDANDLVVKTFGKLTTIFSEEDLMSYGGIQACEDAGVTGVDHVAAADGLKSAFEKIKAGEMFCCSLNSPVLVGQLGAKVAFEIMVEGKDPTSYPDTMTPDPICVTKENVDQYEYLAF